MEGHLNLDGETRPPYNLSTGPVLFEILPHAAVTTKKIFAKFILKISIRLAYAVPTK